MSYTERAMRGKALLDELLKMARERGLAVRREAMSRGTSAGGYCVLKGAPTLFVDERASVDAQVEIVAGVLRRWEWAEEALPAGVHAVLSRRPVGRRGSA